MKELGSFRHSIPLQIRFTDIDRVNHVNNAVYHTYVELGRVHYLNEVLHRTVDWEEKGFVLAHTEIDHIEQIHFRDEIFCYTRIVRLGNKSLQIESRIAKKVGEELVICAATTGVLVAMDYKANKSMLIPDAWRERIRAYEGDHI